MDAVFGPIVLGVILCLLGISNGKGNINSLHWYHRRRITEENRLPFGRMVGLGTLICGVSLVLYGGLSYIAEKTQVEVFHLIGGVVVAVGLVTGVGLTLYAMIKYNKGIF